MITSPPYPMIEMWDQMFSEHNSETKVALKEKNGSLAFELMHKELDRVWDEIYRVLRTGGIACINIGDATRTLNDDFKIYPNHSRILNHCLELGFHPLPSILWVKETNSPNKFMGSGMLPVGAYVTLEHEHILILRKGSKREFKKYEDKLNRQQSSFFWEERNVWFSDKWDLKGTKQKLSDERIRERSAAYPFELAYRLINMFSIKGDTVLDPYLGTGTTMIAAMATGRNSIGVEIDSNFRDTIVGRTTDVIEFSNTFIKKRLRQHLDFVDRREKEKGLLPYQNRSYGFRVVTRQELNILFNELLNIRQIADNEFEVSYNFEPQKEFCFPITKSEKTTKSEGVEEESEEIEDFTEEEETEIQRIIEQNDGLVSRKGAINIFKQRKVLS